MRPLEGSGARCIGQNQTFLGHIRGFDGGANVPFNQGLTSHEHSIGLLPSGTVSAAETRPHQWQATSGDLTILWRSSVRLTTALVIALFPFIFFFDEALELSFSPVLPAIVLLIVLLIAVPFALVEVRARHLRRREKDHAVHIARSGQTSWALLGLSILWFLLWLSLGV